MIVASRRAPGFSGSSPMPSGGVDVHSFMTFGLCTRNEQCAPAPLTNQALHAGCLRVACGLPAGCLIVTIMIWTDNRPVPEGGGDAHSFMTFGLCTRNEKCAPAPLTNQALHAGCTRVASRLPAGCTRVAHGPVWRRHPHDRAESVQLRTSRLKLILFLWGFR